MSETVNTPKAPDAEVNSGITLPAHQENGPTTFATSGQWGQFVRVWLMGTCALVIIVTILNIAVDPFFVFGTPLIAGFNKYKPATQGREGLAKPALLARAQPRTLLMGASKVQVGLDPESAVWAAADRPVFNLGIPGSGLSHAAVLQLRDALAVAPIKRVLIFIEFVDMLEPAGPSGSTARFRTTGIARIGELINAAASLDALEASVETIAAQFTSMPSGLRPNGQMYDGIFRGPTEAEGPGAVFGQKMILNDERTLEIIAHLGEKPHAGIAQLDTLDDIIVICRERGVELDLALPPVHADLLRTIGLAGLWPRYLKMRQTLTDEVARAGGGHVQLWDFMGFNRYSTEPVPPEGKHAPALRWFWEPNHFRPEYGNVLLETIYRGRKGVGMVLTRENVEASNSAQTVAMEQDQASQPGEWARAREALAREKYLANNRPARGQ